MDKHRASLLLLGEINRPEYPQAPESFLTALTWNCYELNAPDEDPRKLALVYRNRDEMRTAKTVRFVETYPRGEAAADWGAVLQRYGLSAAAGHQKVGRCIAESLVGVGVTKSKSQAAVPLSVGISLLQNISGMTGKKGPADIGLIIEQIYALGTLGAAAPIAHQSSASQLWFLASERRIEGDGLLAAIDKGARALLPGDLVFNDRIRDFDHYGDFLGLLEGTPFVWFAEAWRVVTSPEWTRSLPARVWADWATAILRLGFGMTFLWEAAWFENLAREIISGEARTWGELRSGVSVPLPWQPHSASITVRDVSELLGRRVRKAHVIRSCVQEWLSSHDDDLKLTRSLDAMRSDAHLKHQLTGHLSAKPKQSTAKLTWEAVKYALVTREGVGRNVDYYGLLRSHHRFTVVEPAPEWIAVIASVAAGDAGCQTTIQQVVRSLSQLGLEPSTEQLIRLLEAAGLARGSADADQAVLVEAAF